MGDNDELHIGVGGDGWGPAGQVFPDHTQDGDAAVQGGEDGGAEGVGLGLEAAALVHDKELCPGPGQGGGTQGIKAMGEGGGPPGAKADHGVSFVPLWRLPGGPEVEGVGVHGPVRPKAGAKAADDGICPGQDGVYHRAFAAAQGTGEEEMQGGHHLNKD